MTDDGPKEWVTVKVPVADKERADDYRPDESTYGACLVAGAERLNDALDSDTRAYLDGTEGIDVDALADELAKRSANADGTIDTDALASEIARRIDYTALANKTADELEGRMR